MRSAGLKNATPPPGIAPYQKYNWALLKSFVSSLPRHTIDDLLGLFVPGRSRMRIDKGLEHPDGFDGIGLIELRVGRLPVITISLHIVHFL